MANKPGTFKKGDPRINRKGRPPGPSITTEIQRLLKKRTAEYLGPDGTPKKRQEVKAFAEMILQLAMAGDKDFTKMVWNHVDGMPKQAHEVSGPGGKDLVVRYKAVEPEDDDEG